MFRKMFACMVLCLLSVVPAARAAQPQAAWNTQPAIQLNDDSQKPVAWNAAPWTRPVGFIAMGAPANAPAGYLDFCKRYLDDCRPGDTVQPVQLTTERMRDLNTVNADVNDSLFFNSDLAGTDVWDYPQDNIGDCEDYVIEKRARLLERGWPRDALLIAIVALRTPDFADRTTHAVLVARTAQGDYVLDNEIRPAVAWNRAGELFDYVLIQTPQNPYVWAHVDKGTRLH